MKEKKELFLSLDFYADFNLYIINIWTIVIFLVVHKEKNISETN